MGLRGSFHRFVHGDSSSRCHEEGEATSWGEVSLHGRGRQACKFNGPSYYDLHIRVLIKEIQPNGHYGTSVRLNWAKDPQRGIMLAHGMNGEPLQPDHGYPLRVVVPGQIGGRSVKWLRRLIVTAEPSDNWYHYNDNKVLP